jgi:hypothetical protein
VVDNPRFHQGHKRYIHHSSLSVPPLYSAKIIKTDTVFLQPLSEVDLTYNRDAERADHEYQRNTRYHQPNSLKAHTKDSQTLPIVRVDLSSISIPYPPKLNSKVPRPSNNRNIKKGLQPMNFMAGTPYCHHNKDNGNRNCSKRQPSFHIPDPQIQYQELNTKPDEKEEIEFQETRENFIVEVVSVDFPVCAEAFEYEPTEVSVDAVGEVHVRDLGNCSDDGDDN